MKVTPLADMVLLKPIEQEKVSTGGIIIPDTAKEKPMMAEVVSVGPGGMVDGKEVVMCLTAGQKVIYRRYARHGSETGWRRFCFDPSERHHCRGGRLITN